MQIPYLSAMNFPILSTIYVSLLRAALRQPKIPCAGSFRRISISGKDLEQSRLQGPVLRHKAFAGQRHSFGGRLQGPSAWWASVSC